MIFIMAATLLLLLGFFFCIIGLCAKHRRLCTFISGVFFIVSGLVMLFGLVMYISIFKAEVGGKLRSRSQLNPPKLTYKYGYSFLLYVSGFITTELAGIFAVLLFIYRQQRYWHRKRLEDIRRGKIRNPVGINYVHLDHTAFYPCRRHPQAYINSNSAIHIPMRYPSPSHQRRYYFNKEPMNDSPCSLHLHNRPIPQKFGPGSEFYDFPPPPTISYQFDVENNFSRDNSLHFPRDMTSNTVSTTADVNCDLEMTDRFDDYSLNEHDFVTFDLDAPLPIKSQSTASISSTGTVRHNKKDAATDTLRRTTPV